MQNHSIIEAANILQVTEKTIRNYIDRGFLRPEKWNGMWRISREELSEIFWKKYGKKLPANADVIEQGQTLSVQKSEYEMQQQALGKLSALEASENALREENRNLVERNAQLEASAASGWTEARALKEELEKAQNALREERQQANQAKRDIEWLRRELDETNKATTVTHETIEALRSMNERLSDRVLELSLGISG